MFLLALPGRDDIRDTESDTERTGHPRTSAQDLLDIALDFDDTGVIEQDQVTEDEQQQQQHDWGPLIPPSFWEMVWSSPQLQNTVRESYTGPQDDFLLKEIERSQMATIEEELPTIWIPALIVTHVTGEETLVVKARPLSEEAGGQYHSDVFSLIADDSDHDELAEPSTIPILIPSD